MRLLPLMLGVSMLAGCAGQYGARMAAVDYKTNRFVLCGRRQVTQEAMDAQANQTCQSGSAAKDSCSEGTRGAMAMPVGSMMVAAPIREWCCAYQCAGKTVGGGE